MSIIRQRKKNLLFAGLTGAVVTGILACGGIGYSWFKFHQAESNMIAAEQKNTKTVYVLNKDLTAGETILGQYLVPIQVPSNVVPDNVVDRNYPIGKYTKIDVHKNTPLTMAMIYEDKKIQNDLRNEEFKVIQLPSNLKVGQSIDVRIKFPTGQDYIVLTKKKVTGLANGTVWSQLNEKEILSMSSAIVDAYLNNAQIYALTYVEPTLQNDAIPDYPANTKVLDLMNSDPNILNVASQQLEQKVRESLDNGLSQMDPAQKAKGQQQGSNFNKNNTTGSLSTTGNSSQTQQNIFKGSTNNIVSP